MRILVRRENMFRYRIVCPTLCGVLCTLVSQGLKCFLSSVCSAKRQVSGTFGALETQIPQLNVLVHSFSPCFWCFRETSRAVRLLRILSYSVSWYLCNCIWGFPLGLMGMFLWRPGIRGDPTCSPGGFVCAFLLFSPAGRRIYIYTILCSTYSKYITACPLTHPVRA